MTPLPPAAARIPSSLPALRLLGASAAALMLIGCAGRTKPQASGSVDPRIATPPHNLSAAEYPFDDDGTYRKDWVANPAATRRSGRRSNPAPTPAPAPARQEAPAYAYQPPPSAPANPAPYPAAPAPRPTAPPPAPSPRPTPKPAPAPAKAAAARYHTVAKGDTLFSISRRYNVTVPKLKSTNGLSSDTIRIGQTLRIP